MRLGLTAPWFTLLLNVACGSLTNLQTATPAMTQTRRLESSTPGPTASHVTEPAPSPPPANGPVAVFSNTTEVEALAGDGRTLWAATRGGLERYDVTAQVRTRVYTTRDGLPALFVKRVVIEQDGRLRATTARHDCVLHEASDRFSCSQRAPTALPVASPTKTSSTELLEGTPITARWRDGAGHEWLGTAGLGLWIRSSTGLKRVTPIDQISANHVVAIGQWQDAGWFASFDRGLSRYQHGHFSQTSLGPHMLNDVLGTTSGLFVATSEGLYVSRDGESFERERRVRERSISDLAYDAARQVLYATATNSLWEIALGQPKAPVRVTYQPGGSRSLQAVDVSSDGTVFVATEDRGVLRREGKKRFVGFDRLSGYPSSWAMDVLALGGKAALVGSLRHGVFPIGGASTVDAQLDPWILFLGRDATDPGSIFVGTQAGASLIDGNGQRQLEGLPNPCVHSMAHLGDGLWVGTEGGLALYR
jgi:ligand-binding sensor domain-containing protein